MKTIAALLAAPSLLIGVAATASAQNREHQQMAAELRILQEQTQQLSLSLQQALAQLTEAMTAMNTRLDASDTAMRKALADQKVIIDGVGSELRTLRERSQDTSARIGMLAEEVTAMRDAIAAMPAPVAPVDPFDPTAVSSAAPPANGTVAPRPGLSPTRLYDEAWSDFTSGNYKIAITGFQQYVAEFPRFEKADDAQLYIGESYARQNMHQEAIAAFNAVIQGYPAADRLPDAYFQLGNSQRALGQNDAARTTWQTLLKLYPDHHYATLARQRLDGLPAPRQP